MVMPLLLKDRMPVLRVGLANFSPVSLEAAPREVLGPGPVPVVLLRSWEGPVPVLGLVRLVPRRRTLRLGLVLAVLMLSWAAS